jgi:hypothetical protein
MTYQRRRWEFAIGFALALLNFTASSAQLTRGPYLQIGTPTSIVIQWRTDLRTDSRVSYGTNVSHLDRNVVRTTQTANHIVALSNLRPDTKYYYSIGGNGETLAMGPEFFFVTAPTHAKPTRLWVLGDAGTQNFNQRAVRDAYYNFAGTRHTDLWLMLGDNAYGSGTDLQYSNAVFRMYPEMLRKSVLWPAMGNHETYSADEFGNFAYLDIFSLPTAGEAGGVPSGTKKYYSFNHGNIHFVVLDSMTSDRSSDGPMCAWLASDLAENTNEWLIAYWHHPPYTKGTHNSDDALIDYELIEMRESAVPILEAFGVDLVMCGHSHVYERSYLLHGHYGYSWDFMPEMIVDHGSGREFESGPYRKGPEYPPGTVYVVAGSSGQTFPSRLDHPAMFISLAQLGSVVLDIDGARLDATFLRADGIIADTFTILKPGAAVRTRISSFNVTEGTMTITWTSEAGQVYFVERTKSLSAANWQQISPQITATASTTSWSAAIELEPLLFYRVSRVSN